MSNKIVIAFLIVIIGIVLSNGYKAVHLRENLKLNRVRRDAEEQLQDSLINGKDAADNNNQGLIATYWNNFLKRARLPLPSWNITNPISNIFTPYVVEVDSPPQQQQLPNAKPELILLDPATQQYYRVQPVSSA